MLLIPLDYKLCMQHILLRAGANERGAYMAFLNNPAYLVSLTPASATMTATPAIKAA